MNIRNFLFALTGLAAGLALGYFAVPHPPPAPSASPATGTSTGASPITALSGGRKVVTQTVTNQTVKTIDWRGVESEDYKKYVANLRAIGCPEETIRDIIAADVNKLFADRKRALGGANTNKFEYWKGGMKMFSQMFDEEKIKQQQELAKEKRTLLTELLGSAPDEKPDLAAAMGGANILESMLDFLPASKQATVVDVIQKYQAKMMKGMGNGGFDADSMKDITRTQREMEAELAKTLSPQEMEDFNLRMSNTANMMRFQLASFEPNEQEFRDIFKVKKAFDDEFGGYGIKPTEKADAEKYDAAKKEMDAQLKATLGDRYADYARAQDFAYQGLWNVAQRNGLSKETTVQVYDMKKSAETEAKKVRADQSLSAEQLQAALQGITDETERSMRSTMGDKAFESYKKSSSATWLKSLNRPGGSKVEVRKEQTIIVKP